jgi:hypothetical protein
VKFVCEGLPQNGLFLIPPSAPEFAPLLAAIQHRLDRPGDGSPPIPEAFFPRISDEDLTSAILVNSSQKTIAALRAVWQFKTAAGRAYAHSVGFLSPRPLLLPFGTDGSALSIASYWNTIMPGSRRYLSEAGMIGDNRDVRSPRSDEEWPGTVMCGFAEGQAGYREDDPVIRVDLHLDGVFFVDGEFTGRNGEKFFEQVVAEAEAYKLVARIVRECYGRGFSPQRIMAEVENVTAPTLDHACAPPSCAKKNVTQEEFRVWALQTLTHRLAIQKRFSMPDERIIEDLLGWSTATLPHFRQW